MIPFLWTIVGIQGLSLLIMLSRLARGYYPNTRTTGPGEAVFTLVIQTALGVWAAFILFGG